MISKIKNRYNQSESLQKVAKNIGWLFFDKFLRMGVGLIVGAWVARYLGPKQFGMMSYAAAYVALFGSFASFGIDCIIIRELVNNPKKHNELLGSAFIIKIFGALLVLISATISISFIRPHEQIIFALVLLSSSGLIFQSFNVIDLYFQSKVISKYTVLAQNIAFIISSIIKVLLILNKAPLLSFAVVTLVEVVLGSLFLAIVYQYNKKTIFNWRPIVATIKITLNESWPLILASMASMLNMRIDQIFIGKMLDDVAVGNYAVAVRISEVWLMLPMVLGASIYPKIIEAKQKSNELYHKRLNQICFYMCCFVIPVAIGITLMSGTIISVLFGRQYTIAGAILAIHIWSGVPYLTTFAYGQMFYIEKLVKLSFYSSLFAPICNIVLNFLLIPRFGAVGAAATTLVTAFGSGTISLTLLYFFTRKPKAAKNG